MKQHLLHAGVTFFNAMTYPIFYNWLAHSASFPTVMSSFTATLLEVQLNQEMVKSIFLRSLRPISMNGDSLLNLSHQTDIPYICNLVKVTRHVNEQITQ